MKDLHTGWYLIYTKPRHEHIAKLHLQRQGFQLYFPVFQQLKRRRHLYQIVTGPLFPRYLFVHLCSGVDDWSKIRSTRGCVSLVQFGTFPARVPEHLIEQLKRDEANQIAQETTTYQPVFKPGDHVRVADGFLANYEGVVEMKNSRDRITLLLTIAEGHTRSVNLPVDQIEMAG